jgi:hypothetical protein
MKTQVGIVLLPPAPVNGERAYSWELCLNGFGQQKTAERTHVAYPARPPLADYQLSVGWNRPQLGMCCSFL